MPADKPVMPLNELAVLFDYAELPIAASRLTENHEAYTSTLALIRKASPPGLGETVPAVGFKAHWA